MLAFGDVCGDYRLMKHSYEGISTSRRMPGEMLGSYKTACACCLQLNIYSKYTVQMQPHPNGFSLVTSVVRVWHGLFSNLIFVPEPQRHCLMFIQTYQAQEYSLTFFLWQPPLFHLLRLKQTPVSQDAFVAAAVRCFLRDPRNSNNPGNSISIIATCLSFG